MAAAAAWVNAAAVREVLVAALDDWASCAADPARRAWLMAVARQADPEPWRDRLRDPAAWHDAATLARLAAEPAAARQPSPLLAALGLRLLDLGADPEQLLRAAQERQPGDFWVNFALANALVLGHKPDEAMAYYRVALAVRPGTPAVHNGLAVAWDDKGRRDEAIAEVRKGLARDPEVALLHFHLGNLLHDKGRADEAIDELRTAIRLAPRFAPAFNNLGNLLLKKNQLDEAEAAFRTAIDLDPTLGTPHNNLGGVLRARGKRDEALAEFRKATALDPRDVRALYNLGATLRDAGQAEEALEAFRKAVQRDPRHVEAHHGLGLVLMEQGQFAEARQALQRCLDLMPGFQARRLAIALVLRQCEQRLALEQKLAAVLAGQARPASPAEQVDLARLCVAKKRPAAAVRFYADAFAAQPVLTAHRSEAARAAVLAAAGLGEDARRMEDRERAALRRRALTWLREDLALWQRQVEKGTPQQRTDVRESLRGWQQDVDLAAVRDPAALEKMPETERAEWRKLWADVEALRKKVGEGGKP